VCGIAGIAAAGRPDARLVRQMCDTLVHRGPDGSGFHDDDHAALGMRRLAIIDVAGSQQPVYNEDRTVAAVFNGELYNFRELRGDLRRRGHRFVTNGDSECLVHLYEDYGDDLVHHLRGMFAFAIWDAPARRLLLARDRVGKKPLYWREDRASLAFGSELKALVADPAVNRRIDPVALHHYLTYQYVPAPWSIYQGIQKLPPGHLLSWQDGVTKVSRYWRLDFTQRPVTSIPEAAEHLRDLLLDATRVRMLSERPLGAFLSGGLDSSAVVAAMARQTSGPVKTFSIGFENAQFDERSHARRLAEFYGTDHQEFVVTPAATDVLPKLAWHFGEPFADASAIPSFYVARMSSQQVTVVLTGDGGDECFGGYERYALMGMAGRLAVPGFARPGLHGLGSFMVRRSEAGSWPRSVGRVTQALAQPVPRRYARIMSYFTPEQKRDLYLGALRDRLAGVDSYELLDQAYAESHAQSDVGRLMDVDVQTYLPGDLLAKVDITTMACSLEARSPFLDHHLMEWAAGLPDRLKVRSRTTKFLLKQAMLPWLPADLVTRRKQGFGVPIASWLRTELHDLSWDVLTDSTARSRGLFRQEAVSSLLFEHEQGIDHSRQIWALIQFELWHRNFIDAQPIRHLASLPGPDGHLPR
jgi:asparagine synthase (glutamine-hydrolysing)